MTSNTQIRKKMIEELIKEVRGPRHGEEEIISYDPWAEYLTGVVIPRNWIDFKSSPSPDNETLVEVDDTLSDESSNNDDIIGNIISNELSPKSMIKSFGISFSMSAKNPKLEICSTWGRYFEYLGEEESYNLDSSKINGSSENEVWRRFSFGEIFEIIVDENQNYDETIESISNGRELTIIKTLKNFESEKEIDNIDEDGYVKIYIKRLEISNDNYFFSIYMINDLNYVQKDKDYRPDIDKCLFQPSIRIKSNEEIKTQHVDLLNKTEEKLDFLYRDRPIVASGHMCSAIWKNIDYMDKFNIAILWPDYSIRLSKNSNYEKFLQCNLRTEFIPLYPVTLPQFSLDDDSKLKSSELNAEKLSNYSPDEIYDILNKLIEDYEFWINENPSKLTKDEYQHYEKIIKNLINDQENALSRMKNGIKLIKEKDLVYTSFCFANKVMALQNSWENSNSKFEWRPFQIAFFIMNIEDIYYENSKNRDILDLLWIPTGGGKTEAYLGLMAFTIALRRLKAYNYNETGAGTSIISRYTLRLLTVQQFRRTLKMITAAELLRIYKSENGIGWRPIYSKFNGDWIYGSTRFSTGLWVGSGVSPIHLLKSGHTMDLLKGENVKLNYSTGEPAQILKCPICGSWLSVPKSGLNDELNNVHIVINSNEDFIDIKSNLNELFDDNSIINLVNFESYNHKNDFYTISFEIKGKFTQKQFYDEIIMKLKDENYEIASLGDFNIGYFTSLNLIKGYNKNIEGDFDFEIWCTNPSCELNQVEWYEGCPYPNSPEMYFPDGNYKRLIYSPFKDNTRMPIPAYLIDDHIYNRCPTVIISTADKIARLAFEPKASAIFGNVNHFNKYYGYNRNGLILDNKNPILKFVSKSNESIKSLSPPDLIIQDELHLIDGPLGSLFGLYESILSGIIKKQNGNPKYIASTATISNANKQVDLLFSKKLYQFPPHGLNISNNFFVREYDVKEVWDETKAGRLYFGFYAPGKGAMTPQIRLWARMCKVASDNINDDNIKNYWTTVGYFNSIKELGGVLALYRDDIRNRLENIGGDIQHKKLNEDNKEELSSRKSSTELPIILDNLERDKLNSPPKYDGIFTTSMFGTGVDISHLSSMIMTSQPKTTGSYIQATGRIGRKYGGLVVNFFKVGRPRDLNHYEMFSSFHSRIYLDVEPVSVSPFSKGCLSRGLGPSLVAFLRNANDLLVNWQNNEGKIPIKNDKSKKDFDEIKNILDERLSSMEYMDYEIVDSILDAVDDCFDDWKFVADNIMDKKILKIFEYYYKKPQHHVVLGDEGHNYDKNLKVVYKNAPQSLRDVEETIDFWV